MTYMGIADSIKSLIDTMPPTGLVSSIGDYDILNESAAMAVVVDYNTMSGERAEFGSSYFNDWEFELTLAVPFTYAKQAHDDAAALRQHVLDRIGADPTLSNTIVTTLVSRGQSLPDAIQFGGSNWQVELLTVTAREIVEYA